MGRKFYFEQEGGEIVFRTNRKIGDVRIPNYVYDIWMPVIGSDAIGVYGVYCRLEMHGSVKKISQRALAKACRIGIRKIKAINEVLVECGFIEVVKPTGRQKLMHFTTEIVVNDPPQKVSAEIIAKHCDEFEPLTPWLTSPESISGAFGDAKRALDKAPNDDASIASLGLHPLVVESTPSGAIPKITEPKDDFSDLFDSDDSVCPPQEPSEPITLDVLTHTAEQAGRRDDPLWFIQPGQPCGDHDYLEPYQTFCDVIGRDPSTVGEHKTLKWLKQFEKMAQVGDGIVIQPDVMAAAIKAIRDDWNFREKRWATPYSEKFVELVEHVASGIMSGTLTASSKSWSGSL